MTRPIPATASRSIDRPRLTRLLDDVGPLGMALVHAPAGSGKTTLLQQWASALCQAGHVVVWHAVSDNAHDPLSLADHLLQAVDQLGAPDGRQDAPYASAEVSPRLARGIARLAAARPLTVIVDDLHLAKHPAASETLAELARLDIPGFLLVVASRTAPNIPVGHLRASGRLVELTSDDLRFGALKTEDFFRAVGGEALTADESRLVEDRIEGWAAGLRLIALRLGRCADRDAVFAAATTGEQREFAEYFLEEVVADLDPADVAFLMRCCILETMPSALCASLTGRQDAEAVLERFERDSLFTSGVPGRRGWFRLHHIFSDVLRARLLREDANDVAGLHRMAAEWFVAADEPQEAVRHAFLAGDPAWAADLIERFCVFDYLSYGRFEAYHHWMRQLPADVRIERPLLSFLSAWRSINTRQLSQALKTLDELEAQVADRDSPASRIAVRCGLEIGGRLHLMRALVGAYGADFGAAARHIRAIGPRALDDQAFGQVDLDSIHSYLAYHQGNLDQAARLTWKAYRRYEELDCRWGTIHSQTIAALVEMAVGRRRESRRILEEACAMGRRTFSSRSYMVVLPCGLLGAVLYEDGQLAEAEELLAEATFNQQFEGSFGLAERVSVPTIALARLLDATGREAEADMVLARARRLAYQAEDVRLDFELAIERTDRAIRQQRNRELSSELAEIDSLLGEARRRFPPNVWTIWQPFGVLSARRLMLEGRLKEAVAGIEALAAAAETTGRRPDAALLGALAAAWGSNGETGTASHFQDAVAATRTFGLDRSLRDLANPMISSTMTKSDTPRSSKPNFIAEAAEAERPVLTPREHAVLIQLSSGLSNQGIAAALNIEIQTVKTHLKSIFSKLGVTSRTQAMLRARDLPPAQPAGPYSLQ